MKKNTEFVFCLGVHASASTWVFNVVRKMYEHCGKKTSGFAAEELSYIFARIDESCDVCIIKAHSLDERLIKFIKCQNCKIILSTRNLKDVAVSMMDRFGSKSADVPIDITKSLCSLSLIDFSNALILRYEDRFYNFTSTLSLISNFLSIEIDVEKFSNLIDYLLFENIKRITSDKLYTAKSIFHVETLFHKNHNTDGRIDKWKHRLSKKEVLIFDRLLRNVEEIVNGTWPEGELFVSKECFHCNNEENNGIDGKFYLTGNSRCIVWGPYYHLPKGHWRAIYDISFPERGERTRIKLDVMSSSEVVALREIPVPNALADEFSVEFYQDDHFRRVELRIHSIGDGRLCPFKFSGVRLERILPPSPALDSGKA